MDELRPEQVEEDRASTDEFRTRRSTRDVIDRLAAYGHEAEPEPRARVAVGTDVQPSSRRARAEVGAVHDDVEPSDGRGRAEPDAVVLERSAESRRRRFGRRPPVRRSAARQPKRAEAARRASKEKRAEEARRSQDRRLADRGGAGRQQRRARARRGRRASRSSPASSSSGEIRDPDALGDALKRFFELHKLPKRGVRLGVSNNRIGVRIFEIEGVSDPPQLENAIRFRAEEVLPIPLDQAVLDYVVLERARCARTAPSGGASCSSSRTARSSTATCRRAARPGSRSSASTSRRSRSFARSSRPRNARTPPGALVGVAIGHDRTTIAVSTGRHCEFARVLDWGGWSLNVAIARELDRAPSEVESIKRQLSFAHRDRGRRTDRRAGREGP